MSAASSPALLPSPLPGRADGFFLCCYVSFSGRRAGEGGRGRNYHSRELLSHPIICPKS